MGFFSRWAKPKSAPAAERMDWRAFVNFFAQHMQDLLTESDGSGQLQIDWGESIEDTTIILRLGSGQEFACYMGNHYQRYCQQPDELQDLLEIVLNSLRDIWQEQTPKIEQIFPVLRNHEWLAGISANKQAVASEENLAQWLITGIAGDLLQAYVLDMSSSMRVLNADLLAQMEISPEDVHEIAMKNLLHYVQENPLQCSKSEQGVYQIGLDSDYDSALLLLFEHVLEGIGLDTQAAYYLGVPERATFLFCAAKHAHALNALREQSKRIYEQAVYPISGEVYRYQQGEIILEQRLQ